MTDEIDRIVAVTQADRDAAALLSEEYGEQHEADRIRAHQEQCDHWPDIQAFARHRQAAIAERDAQIVAWLREDADTLEREDTAWQAAYLAEAIRECADAIERGEVGESHD